ncbi:MAG TPA: RsmD family RNA methyltransferase [Candidatus Azoamicus sp.]
MHIIILCFSKLFFLNLMKHNFIFYNNKRLFFNSSVKPTKNIIRKQFFSWIFSFIDKLYIIDFFCGSCVFGIQFYNSGSKKILNFDIKKENISNIYISLNNLNIYVNDKFLLYHFDSLNWIKKINILNFSLIILDPPYSFEKFEKFLLKIIEIKFLRRCLILFLETNLIFHLSCFSYDFFLIRKNVIGNVLFFLIKKI